ncbi:hypothetical protein DPX16_21991 [Anabarilius grahami]|uniref:Uncharacterized protein n=1 Tax=Anabarilius grahami TaxID=495550 RepID=A0A3N0XMR1_ANAGA|nr:hypothetical protein DPX16_21991 [Anabarilius grahami]
MTDTEKNSRRVLMRSASVYMQRKEGAREPIRKQNAHSSAAVSLSCYRNRNNESRGQTQKLECMMIIGLVLDREKTENGLSRNRDLKTKPTPSDNKEEPNSKRKGPTQQDSTQKSREGEEGLGKETQTAAHRGSVKARQAILQRDTQSQRDDYREGRESRELTPGSGACIGSGENYMSGGRNIGYVMELAEH